MMWPLGCERCGPRLTGELRKPITAPRGSLTHWLLAQAPLPGHKPRFYQVHPLAQPRGNLGFPDDHSAQRRREAPKNITTFNTHTEALEPMAGARPDPLRCLVPRVRPVKGGRLGFTTLLTGAIGVWADLDARHRAVLSFDAHERGFFTAG